MSRDELWMKSGADRLMRYIEGHGLKIVDANGIDRDHREVMANIYGLITADAAASITEAAERSS